MKKLSLSAAVCTALLIAAIPAAYAQEDPKLDVGRLVIAGYGDVSYTDIDGVNTNVVSRFTPIFLFQLSEKIHIESELEFSITETGETEVEMEYADLHYFLNDNTVITVGKFLLPFGFFGPNLHPSWVNKMPDMPGVYGHHGSSLLRPLLPILSDTGINIRNSFSIGSGKLFTDFYVVGGPHEELINDETLPDSGVPDELGFPEVDFETLKGDFNSKSAFGGRVAYAFLPQLEIGYSFYGGAYDAEGALDYNASAIDINWNGTFASVHSEFINTTTEGFNENGVVQNFDRNGWYVQGNWQMRQLGNDAFNPFELVMRYSKITEFDSGKRWTAGVNYWLEPSAVLKLSYQDTSLDNGDNDNRIFMQLAFGF